MSGGADPLVPPDFNRRALPMLDVAAGEPMFRSYATGWNPIFFGTRTRSYRFDDPLQDYGVMYVGRSEEAAFAETFLRTPGRTLLTLADLAARGIARIASNRPLRLARLHSQAWTDDTRRTYAIHLSPSGRGRAAQRTG